jgi:hypothetical protein
MLHPIRIIEERGTHLPTARSAQSYQYLEDHLEIFLRKSKRRAQANEETRSPTEAAYAILN